MAVTYAVRPEIRSLTGLRGLAACWVAMYHLHTLNPLLPQGGVFLNHGYLAVDIFFVLSGLVMTLSYEHLFAAGTTARSYSAFLLRRLARVYPLYLALTLIAAAIQLRNIDSLSSISLSFCGRILINTLMVQSWGLTDSIDGPAWSVSTELGAYLLFPLLLAVFLWGKKVTVALGVVLSGGLIVLASMQPTPVSYPFTRQGPMDVSWAYSIWPLIRCISEFSFGIIAFRIAHKGYTILSNPAYSWIIVIVASGLLFVPNSDLAFFVLVPFLLLALLQERHPVSRLLSSKGILALGHWSYAIYLWHFLLIPIVKKITALTGQSMSSYNGALLGEGVFWIILLVLAALSYKYVERPCRMLIRALEMRLFPGEERKIASAPIG